MIGSFGFMGLFIKCSALFLLLTYFQNLFYRNFDLALMRTIVVTRCNSSLN